MHCEPVGTARRKVDLAPHLERIKQRIVREQCHDLAHDLLPPVGDERNEYGLLLIKDLLFGRRSVSVEVLKEFMYDYGFDQYDAMSALWQGVNGGIYRFPRSGLIMREPRK